MRYNNTEGLMGLDRTEEPVEELGDRYLLFYMNGDLYGANILQIREVIKAVTPKPVPFMKDYFKGVINLRGQIISVLQLQEKLKIKKSDAVSSVILIVRAGNHLLGVLVDDIKHVRFLRDEDIQKNLEIETEIPKKYLGGIAKDNGKLITIIDIEGCLSFKDQETLEEMKQTA